MTKWLTPKDIQTVFSSGKTKAYELLKEYEESGGEVIYLGQHQRRVHEEKFTEFLKSRGKHEKAHSIDS